MSAILTDPPAPPLPAPASAPASTPPSAPSAFDSDQQQALLRTRKLYRVPGAFRDPKSRPGRPAGSPARSWHAPCPVADDDAFATLPVRRTVSEPRKRSAGSCCSDLLDAASLETSFGMQTPSDQHAELFCEVCWQPTADPVGCEGCAHRYCAECLSRYWTREIFAGRHARVQCMYGLCCAVTATDSDIRRVVSDRTFRKMIYFRSRDQFAHDENVAWCVREMCWAPILPSKAALRRKDPTTHSACVQCRQCGTKNCFECGQLWHPDTKCPRANSKPGTRSVASRAWTKLHTKPCPHCKVRIQKSEGCKHMNCTRCGASFCWRCGGQNNHNARGSCRCDSVLTGIMYTTIAALVIVGSPVLVAGAVVAGPPYCVYKAYRKRKDKKAIYRERTGFSERSTLSPCNPKPQHYRTRRTREL